MKSLVLFFILVGTIAVSAVIEQTQRLTSAQAKSATGLGLLQDQLDNENWPNDGPWIVNIIPGEGNNERVSNEAASKSSSLRGSGKPYNLKYNFKTDNSIVVDGITKEQLHSIAGVISVVPDYIRYASVAWGLDRIDQPNLPLSNSYTPTYGACGVDVYVVDTGLDTTHQEFAGGSRTVSNIFNVYGSATAANTDDNGHGTHCAGTVGGVNVGVSPCANIYGLKVLSASGSGYTSDIIAALNFVQNRHQATAGAKSVVSMSLGGSCGTNCASDSLVLKVQSLAAAGIISAVAAGNSNANAANYSPAAAVDAVTVGATESTDARASYSNYGAVVDIFAPGSSIISACSSLLSNCAGGNSYLTYSGTSMATPHVAGVLAQQILQIGGTQNSLSYVSALRNKLVADSTGASLVTNCPTGTTRTQLQVPTMFNPTTAPTSPPVPTLPTIRPPTKRPTRKSE